MQASAFWFRHSRSSAFKQLSVNTWPPLFCFTLPRPKPWKPSLKITPACSPRRVQGTDDWASRSKFSVNIYCISEQDALNDVMQTLEITPGSSKASDFPVLLPANNVPDQSIKLAVLASTGKSKKGLGAQLFPAQVKRHSVTWNPKCKSRHSLFIARNANENPSSETTTTTTTTIFIYILFT